MVAVAIAVARWDARATTVAARVVHCTAAVIVSGCIIVVARRGVGTARNFVLVADVVTVQIVVTVFIAVGYAVVVKAVSASSNTSRFNGQGVGVKFTRKATGRKGLDVQRSAQLAVGRELREQDTAVFVRISIGITVENVPSTANFIINHQISAGNTSTRIEGQSPVLYG